MARIIAFACWIILMGQISSAQIAPPQLLCLKGDTLIWSLPPNPCGPFEGLEVYFSTQRNGPYTLLTTITDEMLLEFIHNPGAIPDRFYYIRSRYNCPGMFSNPSDTLDNKPPLPPFVNYVSVINGQVHLSWQNSLSPQTRRYIIYRATQQGTVPIDTVENINTYIDPGANPDQQIEYYYILSMDECETKSPFDQLHNTMLPELSYDSCSREAFFSWNAYNFWPAGVGSYEVFLQVDGGAPQLAAIRQPADRSYVFPALQNGRQYCFWTEALEEGSLNRAVSSRRCIQPSIVTPVDLLCLSRINTNAAGRIEVEWQINDQADVVYMRLLRAENANGPFQVIATYGTPLNFTYAYTDSGADSGSRRYYYQLETLDLCGVTTRSDLGASLFLQAELLPGRRNRVYFDSHFLENSDLLDYQLYRINGQNQQPLALLTPGTTEYVDEITGPSTGGTQFCYRLAAIYAKGCPVVPQPSFSNIACVEQNSSIVLPNAFAPDGRNRIFKPVLLYRESIASYEMTIFDRWGAVLFTTLDPDGGWDGTSRGKIVPTGTYVVVVRATQNNGRQLEEKGSVTLLR
jgi:gliding motility-associated-like protein